MKKILGLLLERIQKKQRNSAQFVSELRTLAFAYVLVVIVAEASWNNFSDSLQFRRDYIVLFFIVFYCLYWIIEGILSLFISGKWVSLISIIPSVPLVYLFLKIEFLRYLILSLAVAVVVRLFFVFSKKKEFIMTYGIFLLDIVAVCMWLFNHAFEKTNLMNHVLLAILSIMTLSSLQKILVERNRGAFPFHYFLLIGLLVSILPMKDTPIDWTFVKAAWGKVENASENAAYYISTVYDKGNYSTGYSSLNVNGGKIKKSKKSQLKLITVDTPYNVYMDADTGKMMQAHKVLYLQGADTFDNEQLVSFLTFLYNHNLEVEDARVFTQVQEVSVEYVYLNTDDEILPVGTFALTRETEGKHKKGYKEKAEYFAIDYGSPLFVKQCYEPTSTWTKPSYEEAELLMKKLYNLELKSIISKEQYVSVIINPEMSAYLDTTGATPEMKDLADSITKSSQNEYEKCKQIQTYLRQYPYSTEATGGYDEASTMATTEGMADIANRFLFDTKEGYCVHFTASMVMLLREAGIPARVQHGYRYSFPFEKQDEYIVPASCAHVWPEAYIKDVGWVPFEPTSAYYTSEDLTWHRGEEGAEQPYISSIAVPKLVSPAADEISYHKTKINKLYVVGGIAAAILSIILLVLAAVGIIALITHIKYKYSSPEEKIKIDVENIKNLLNNNSKEKIYDRGLLSDYLAAVPITYRSKVEQIFSLYYRILYGTFTQPITELETLQARQLYKSLKTAFK